jgi:protein required for attachment to host cells
MLIPHATIIAVIDGRNLELWRNAGDEAAPALEMVPAPKLDDHNHSGVSHHGSAVLMTEDSHAIAAVEWLGHEVQAQRIGNLVVIAPPRALGELRKHYSKALSAALIGDVAKDLVGRKADAVLEHLHAH